MVRRLTAASAIAEHLGWNLPDVTETRSDSQFTLSAMTI